MTVEQLPSEIREAVGRGWVAVVYKGLQVWGLFPQLRFAHGFVANITGEDGVYDRKDFEYVTDPGARVYQ